MPKIRRVHFVGTFQRPRLSEPLRASGHCPGDRTDLSTTQVFDAQVERKIGDAMPYLVTMSVRKTTSSKWAGRFSIALPFGSAIHSVIEMGRGLQRAFYEGIDLTGFEVVDVELPLTARLYTEEGQSTELMVTGILDVVLKDAVGDIVATDNKTAKNPYSQETVDEDLQLSSYAYLLAANRFVPATADVRCRFDVMRKLKTPKFEQLYTVRTATHRRRFAKIANAVLAGIDARVFVPCKSWLCSDCQYAKACGEW